MTELQQQTDLLRPYRPEIDGPWTTQEAAHLLRRAQFGASAAEIDTAVEAWPRRSFSRSKAVTTVARLSIGTS